MRLIYAHQNPLTSPDPASLQVINTCAALAKESEVHLIASKGGHESIGDYYNLCIPNTLYLHLLKRPTIDLPHLRFTWNLPFYVASLIKILQIVRMQKIDALLVRNLKLGHFLLKWCRFLNIPLIIFETHEIFTLSFRDEINLRGKNPAKEKKLVQREAYVYRKADGLICITRHLADMIKDKFETNVRILVAPDGVDLDSLSKNALSLAGSSRGKLGKTLLYLGSLHHWKGIDVLIKAMQYLPGIFLLVVGGNADNINYYHSFAEQHGVRNRVHFEGFVVPSRRFEYFHIADVCILPLKPVHIASYFTSPLKLFEYMASGKPIVASDLPAIREILSHNINSILVPSDNPEALAGGVRYILENPAIGEKIARQAAVDVLSYTWDKRTKKIMDFIRSYGKP